MEKKKLRCSKCNYTFFPRGENKEIPFRCPYCAREGTVSETKHILEEI